MRGDFSLILKNKACDSAIQINGNWSAPGIEEYLTSLNITDFTPRRIQYRISKPHCFLQS
jgi:hypothetical protein